MSADDLAKVGVAVSKLVDVDALESMAHAAKARADAATNGPWRWWTSNSFRRLSSDPSGKDGDVACAVRHPVDGWPDIRISEEDQTFIAAARSDVPRLADAVLRLAAEVRRPRGGTEASESKPGAALCDLEEPDFPTLIQELYDHAAGGAWHPTVDARSAMPRDGYLAALLDVAHLYGCVIKAPTAEHSSPTWQDDAGAWLTIQIAAEDRDDLIAALTEATKRARACISEGKDGSREEQFCSGAERITLRFAEEGP